MRFGVEGLGSRVCALCFLGVRASRRARATDGPVPLSVKGLGFGVWGLGFRAWGLGCRAWGLGFMA